MLQAARRDQELLQREADRIPDLLRQIEDSRAESERLFRQAQVAMFRCTREGTIIQVNRAWSALVRRTIDDLQSAAATAAIFESPGELSWLIDRCLSTRSRESIETTVRREDGVRLFVRMSASASASNVIEIVVEDLTRPRVLQDRLAQAGRMEAVGRLASEVALTCDRLLGDVRHHAEQWLMDAGGIGASRQHGEMLLDELTRAAGYLQQLAAYGDKQTRAPALVDLPTVVRDLVPVLKHVAGDHVDVRLPDPSSALTVDVESERIERLLVNLAAYGRERMSGRLTIEVGTSVVDRQFAARYPNVRPGPHALITVTEVRRAPRANALLPQRADSSGRNASPAVAQKPAVDLATLQGLVGECGGHLWMKVQPLGEIVAKIRLPLLTAYGQAHAPALAARAGRGRTIARWFHH
jgi:PAS domain S-box-containing protein